MSGSTEVAIANPRRARMPDEYVLIGASMNWPMSANSTMPRQPLLDDRVVDAHERPGEEDVLAAGQLLVEAGAEGQQARDVAADLDDARPTA